MQDARKAEKNSHRNKFTENQFFRCFVLRDPAPEGRIRLRIAKRIIPLAVRRNKIKRWIRESSRTLGMEGRSDICVTLRKAPPAEFKEFSRSMKEVLTKCL
ncbi:MAG: ribonuclease P protein component [Elusimicrobiota bacterium]|nr:ribonuclease P protein component [Elusimicrobiota bacterium]